VHREGVQSFKSSWYLDYDAYHNDGGVTIAVHAPTAMYAPWHPLRRCPNGHPYYIGECGQAMMEGRCPECSAPIGGRSHTLQAGNALASEMLELLRQHQRRQQAPQGQQ